ncbi:outer membrane protein assembly factor BamB [Streptomyces sp. SAI-135]|jgi:outer membrane protein assembly factor BamB|uniref:outer membrane protein assembly factor BamB family protein n=1 Tax=unclassified Streptomyces TaxID=2593676 RepID=UPI00247634DB|nr:MULTISPECIES: PQQ-binding-like beta-propeller repeat protein [unclassified Streptomyces]MDH6521802.1 outer membrane protein assembly factor BamB [Streptomyces sp. SAI-090]MDH6554091.1 outer membrane protein assembly factor BamB [Streptomyces sp. SAI-041]MDH6573168.1 outer membrane protein assembly factor BamB [Streptomyces sp. SAI-117]MDH6614097.1 outer membrane protein assembly factor BamB [Streptomyces sp. SAI-135]
MGVDHPAAVPAPWTTPVDTTLSAGPTATRRTMYAGDTNGTVYALNPATGQPRWSAPLDPATGPVTANGPVFAADHNGRIQTLNATTGRRRWSP